MDRSLSVSRKRTTAEDWSELAKLLGEDRTSHKQQDDEPWKCQEWRFLRPSAVPSQRETQAEEEEERFWVPHADEGYVISTLKAAGEDTLTLQTARGPKEVRKDKAERANPLVLELCEDMAQLSHLNDASVLHNLRQRYKFNLIHTYSGLFCLSINPWRQLPIYTPGTVKLYKGRPSREMPPHVYAVAEAAYTNLLEAQASQSILITGESGAGKTENVKKIMQYFAVIAASGSETNLEEQIMESNPVLEAFGNAKTVHNDNSSRFGKFTKIYFDESGRVAGAELETYLLEKSRVISQSSQERSFHVFYQLLSDGTSKELKELTKLSGESVESLRFVGESLSRVDGVDDDADMAATQKALQVLGLSMEERLGLFQLTAAVLLLGQLQFTETSKGEAYIRELGDADDASELLQVKSAHLVDALCEPRVRVGDELVKQSRNLAQVTFSVAAVAKSIYERTFGWLVRRCNAALKLPPGAKSKRFIGVLDIAGFEIFPVNSFEQLCINYTNERLQQFFNHRMFVVEQEEYRAEGIPWKQIDYGLDLQPTIDLMEKPLGIFSLLEEECVVPKGSDKNLVEKLEQQFFKKNHIFGKPKPAKTSGARGHFSIAHYAGVVNYNAEGWLDKNKDPLSSSLLAVFKASTQPLMRDMWEAHVPVEQPDKGSGKRKASLAFATVSSTYRGQLASLLATLNSTAAHFVRCLVPNRERKPGLIDAPLMLHQLRCNGVLEGIRIARQGYPNRLPYAEFAARYRVLDPREADWYSEPRETSSRLTEAAGLVRGEDFELGFAKIFCRSGVLGTLEVLRSEKISQGITAIQAQIRSKLALAEAGILAKRAEAVETLQYNVLHWISLHHWPWFCLLGRVRCVVRQNKYDAEAELRIIEEAKKELEDVIASRDADIADLHSSVRAADARTEAEREHSRRKDLEIAHLHDQFEERDLREARLCNEIRQAETIAQKMDGELFTEKLKTKELDKRASALDVQVKDLSASLAKERRERQEWETAAAQREAQFQSLLDQLAKLQEEKTAAEVGLTRKTMEADTLRVKLEELKEKLAALAKQLQMAQGELSETTTRLTEEKFQRRRAENDAKDYKAEAETFLQKSHHLEKSLDGLAKSGREKDAELFRLRKALKEAEAKKEAALSEQRQIHQATTAQLQKAAEESHRKSLKLESANTQLQARLESAEARTEPWRSSLGRPRRSSSITDTLKAELESVMSRSFTTARSSSTTDFRTRRMDELERENGRLQSDKRMAARELEVVKTALADEHSERDAAMVNLKAARLEADQLRRKAEAVEEKSEDLRKDVVRAQADATAARTKAQQALLEKERDFENERRRLSGRLRELEEERARRAGLTPGGPANLLAALEEAKETLQNELRDCQAQLRRALAELENSSKSEAAKEAAVASWQTSYTAASDQIEELKADNVSLTDQLRRAHKALSTASTCEEAEVGRLREAERRLSAELASVQRDAADDRADARRRDTLVRADLDQQRAQRIEAEVVATEAQEAVDRISDALERASEDRAALHEDLAELQHRLATLETERSAWIEAEAAVVVEELARAVSAKKTSLAESGLGDDWATEASSVDVAPSQDGDMEEWDVLPQPPASPFPGLFFEPLASGFESPQLLSPNSDQSNL